MSEELQFRSAAFGGFHKQDVLNYIETTAKEHKNKVEGLEKELADTKAGKEQLEEEAKAAAGREEALTGREAELRAQAEQLSDRLHEQNAALEAARAELERKAAMLAQTEERLRRLEPAAEAYESLKDKAAGIELDAHRRGQLIEAEARERVRKTHAELEQWLVRVRTGYDRLRTDVDATISHAAGELDRVARSLEGISAEFAEHDAALEALSAAFHEGESPKAPQPLPVDGV